MYLRLSGIWGERKACREKDLPSHDVNIYEILTSTSWLGSDLKSSSQLHEATRSWILMILVDASQLRIFYESTILQVCFNDAFL